MRDWYLYVDDNDGKGQREATAEEIREFLQVAASKPQWNTSPLIALKASNQAGERT